MANINTCRLCSTTGNDYMNIFSEIGIGLNLREIINEHFKCEISEADPLPHLVCQSCWSTTEAFHELYQKSKIVQDQFLHHEHKFGADINEESPDEIDEQPILEEPHFIGTFKEEPDFSSILEEPTDFDNLYETSEETNDNSNDYSDFDRSNEAVADGDAPHIKPYLQRWKLAKKKKKDFTKLFLENKYRFDMNCEKCDVVFTTFSEARRHYRDLHAMKNGYIKCCNVKLIYRCKIIEHLYRHLDPEKYRCGVCGKQYSSPHHLKTHFHRAHTDHPKVEKEKELVECDICKKEFSSKLYLRKHIQCHSEKSEDEQYRQFISDNMDMSCDLCSAVFTTFYEARRHYRDLHAMKKGYIKCCDTKLNEFWLVIDHINSHLNPQVFTCGACGKTFADRKKFYLHQRRHRQALERPFICDYCGKSFGNKENITQHLFNNHVSSEPKYECETCHKRFHLMSLLKNHFYSVHREKKANVTCEVCGKSFNIKASFDKHMLSHVDKEERLAQRQQCEYCGEWLLSKSGIYYHEKIHNGEIQKCKQCDKELPHKLALLAHIRKYHREPKFKCSHCEKSYDISSKLVKHEESHTRHKVYECKFCCKTFAVITSLKTHIRRNHRDAHKESMKQMIF